MAQDHRAPGAYRAGRNRERSADGHTDSQSPGRATTLRGTLDALELAARYEKTRTVVHVHATHIVAAIYAGFDLQAISAEFHEISRYTRVGPTVPGWPALSRELADVTANCFSIGKDGALAFDIVGQAYHGACAAATNPWAAYEHIQRLDPIC